MTIPFSLFAMTTVATALPMRFVIARASLMKRSTPSSSATPSTGTTFIAESVLASTMKPEPVTPAAPLDVIMRIASTLSCCPTDRSMWYACAMKSTAIDR